MERQWIFKPIAAQFDRSRFDCGKEPLNRYIQQFARQNHDRGIAKTFVALPDAESVTIAGFYATGAASITFAAFPNSEKRLPRYPIPVMRIAQLAVDRRFQGMRLGEELLMEALHRAILVHEVTGIYAVVVDAIDDEAKHFYQRYEFTSLMDSSDSLFLSMKKVLQLLD
jgi:ribosomal protein S18 acetylase RimI-like enzyme